MLYRTADQDDLPAIRAILDAPQNLGKLGAYDEASLYEALGRPDHLFRCVDVQEQLGAFIWLTGLQDKDRGPKIEEFGATMPGRGVGTTLLLLVREELLAMGHDQLWLAVAADNSAAIRLYLKLGFIEKEVRPAVWHRRQGAVADALIMTSSLIDKG